MTPEQRSVYNTTGAMFELINALEQRGVLTDEQHAARVAIDILDQHRKTMGWPEDWRHHAHMYLIDAAD